MCSLLDDVEKEAIDAKTDEVQKRQDEKQSGEYDVAGYRRIIPP